MENEGRRKLDNGGILVYSMLGVVGSATGLGQQAVGQIMERFGLALLLAAVGLCLTTLPVMAGTFVVSIPEFSGAYSIVPYSDRTRTVYFAAPFDLAEISSVRLSANGAMAPGYMPPGVVYKHDSFTFILEAGPKYFWNDLLVDSGSFVLSDELVWIPGAPTPGGQTARLRVFWGPGTPDPPGPYDPPFVPSTATLTDAYLVLEGPNVPEPALLALLAAGSLVAFVRRRGAGRS